MGKRERYAPGAFSWVELATPDAAAAKAFYAPLLGWECVDTDAGGTTYTMCTLGGDPVAALYGRADGPPAWLSYATVESADETAARAAELGATALAEPFDVMQFGRMAVLADPQGAVFAIWEPRAHIGAHRVNEPGCFCWNQLVTSDPEAAQAFYAELLGWDSEREEGELPYWTIRIDGHENGGIRAALPGDEAPPRWVVWFTVASLDDALAHVESAGGAVVVPRRELPPIGWFALAADPQGAAFALFEGEVDP